MERIFKELDELKFELPSWAFSDAGTRFAVFHEEGAARNVFERIEDAALVHRLTGCCPSVALHIPWDKVENWEELREFAEEKGLKIGAINPNLFQDPDYKYGSLTNPSEKIRKKAIAHVMECVDIAEKTGSKVISLWLADGTDYPGQDDFRSRKKRLEESLRYIYENMPADMYLLIEYKFFEPAFYHTDIPDWGMSYLLSEKLGERALVLVDLGHHPQGTNIEYIVATLLSEKKLGGFHLNNRKYADDDLTIASINPYEVFLIFKEIVFAKRDPELSDSAKKVVLMFDQAHITKPKILAMIQSVLIAQELFTKALLIDENRLREAQKNYDVVEAEEILLDAFRTDVRPILREYRRQKGLPEDPLRVFREEDYMEKRRRERR
ncbi:sugar isomerase [Thermotoga maritima MSB8]|nr:MULTISPECIES: L-rhamnose isomerase [Thermotoga]AGL49999.1 putative L-rhamnose isomerase RhaI [Thermotoga maritima MSB8]AKE26982.1 sugar isomerase [Thermotoga maritima]AKE28847.1 sugar isomerase [Thermotoga maritima MSB8]AKE30720.1 sugar isomerase [Thermotoga maritima]KAF2960083.1 sugar isomerase [Thermotoga sp. 38H-to]